MASHVLGTPYVSPGRFASAAGACACTKAGELERSPSDRELEAARAVERETLTALRNRKAWMADIVRMNIDPFCCVLWLGSLIAASDPTFDPLPASLDEIVATYLSLVRPMACA